MCNITRPGHDNDLQLRTFAFHACNVCPQTAVHRDIIQIPEKGEPDTLFFQEIRIAIGFG
jgi:hypothetical protein